MAVMKCLRCGEWFTQLHSASKYCSDECRLAALREQKNRWYHDHKEAVRKEKERVKTLEEQLKQMKINKSIELAIQMGLRGKGD